MSGEQDAARRAAIRQQQAEHRAIVQASMQAKRSGKLPARVSNGPSEVFTALAVVVVVIGMLVLVFKFAQ
jgi:hypothetical protein